MPAFGKAGSYSRHWAAAAFPKIDDVSKMFGVLVQPRLASPIRQLSQLLAHQSDQPPSTDTAAPVTNAPRSALIQSTASAISSGFPNRPTGSRSMAF